MQRLVILLLTNPTNCLVTSLSMQALSFNFQCKDPGNVSETVSLNGIETYDAAFWCASQTSLERRQSNGGSASAIQGRVASQPSMAVRAQSMPVSKPKERFFTYDHPPLLHRHAIPTPYTYINRTPSDAPSLIEAAGRGIKAAGKGLVSLVSFKKKQPLAQQQYTITTVLV
jgi:hypothetical protein